MTTSGPRRLLLGLAVAFLLVRAATVLAYRDTLYYYGMVSNQFAIAEAAYKGHWFAWDKELAGNVMREAKEQDLPPPGRSAADGPCPGCWSCSTSSGS